MAITLDIARDNPNAHTVSAEAVLPGEDKPTLIGLSREELGEALGTIGVPQKQWRMRASQLWHWLYVRGVSDFAQMTNIAKELRQKLDQAFTIARPEIVSEQISVDGTRKWLFRFPARGAGRPVEVE